MVIEEMIFDKRQRNEVLVHSGQLLQRKIAPGSAKKRVNRKRQESNGTNDSPNVSGGGGFGVTFGTSVADRASAATKDFDDLGTNTTMREGMLMSSDVYNMVLQNVETEEARALEVVTLWKFVVVETDVTSPFSTRRSSCAAVRLLDSWACYVV
ncbi:hypothetical protein LY76DRAFT_641121 [Colletotrichum caudatum]|nr:hypothetical protein LY76DRAFT_641121 [Colletotrichum caudatum]